MIRYKQMRVPADAYAKLMQKKMRIEDRLFSITRKKVPVKLTRLVTAISDQTIKIDDEYLVNAFYKRKKC